MGLESARRYEGISAKAYEHPADRAATAALGSIPMLDQVVKLLSDFAHERRFRQVLLGNAVRVGGDQVPAMWTMYRRSANVLDITDYPDLYLTQTPLANALTIGARKPVVIVFSGLVTSFEPREVEAVLAHELGHVLSEHYAYTTALIILTQVVGGAISLPFLAGLPVRALYFALLEWARMAELSSDRASALVLDDPLPVCQMLMRMAGGAVPGMSLDAFIRQATEYETEDDLYARHARFWVEVGSNHPFAVRRVRELIKWITEGDFDHIRAGRYVRQGQELPPSAEFDAAVKHYGERFRSMFDRVEGGVQRVTDQIGAWLRRRQETRDDTGDPDASAPS